MNTTQAINIIEQITPPKERFLATIDVKSLYTNIPQQQGTDRVLKRYYNTPLPQHMPPHVATFLTKTILKHNHVEFNGLTYRQIQGVAMGTKCAPTFANIFMGSIEEDFLELIQNQGNPMPTVWIRYIDDIFVIWPHSKEQFLEFFNKLNDHHPTIKYTH